MHMYVVGRAVCRSTSSAGRSCEAGAPATRRTICLRVDWLPPAQPLGPQLCVSRRVAARRLVFCRIRIDSKNTVGPDHRIRGWGRQVHVAPLLQICAPRACPKWVGQTPNSHPDSCALGEPTLLSLRSAVSSFLAIARPSSRRAGSTPQGTDVKSHVIRFRRLSWRRPPCSAFEPALQTSVAASSCRLDPIKPESASGAALFALKSGSRAGVQARGCQRGCWNVFRGLSECSDVR